MMMTKQPFLKFKDEMGKGNVNSSKKYDCMGSFRDLFLENGLFKKKIEKDTEIC